MKNFGKCLVSIIILACTAAGAPAKNDKLILGPVTLEINISRTAHLFHVVDQISNWSEFCHDWYRDYFETLDGGLTARDKELLARHRAVRKLHKWHRGLEQTFYTTADLDSALKRGVAAGHLTSAEADTEREVFMHFAPRIEALMAENTKTLEAFRKRLDDKKDDLRKFAEKVSRFCGGGKITVPVYLMANPDDHKVGGGYNGGRLTLEIPRASNAYPSFQHELMHAFIGTQRDMLNKTAEATEGLGYMTLNEGIAYALSPGILHNRSDDPLAKRVCKDLVANKPLSDNYTRFNRFGLALRPLLREALMEEKQTLAEFLPRAADAWLVVAELDLATRGWKKSSEKERGWFSFGPGWKILRKVWKQRKSGLPLWARKHDPQHYRELLSKAAPGSKLFLLFALDHKDKRIPEGYEDLFPKPWPEVEQILKQGKTVELTGKARGLNIILLAAPTMQRLEELIQSTELTQKDN